MRSPGLAAMLVAALLAGEAPLDAQASGFVIVHRQAHPPRVAHRQQPQGVRHSHSPHHVPAPHRHAHAVRQPVAGPALIPAVPLSTLPRVLVVPPVRVVSSVPRVIHAPAAMPLVAAPLVAPAIASVALPGPTVLGSFAFAIDGDTFDAGGVRYRLSGIDTPELYEPRGPAARERLQTLLRWGNVVVVPVARDVYGRIVAQVLVAGIDVAAILRSEGFAK